MSRSGLQRGSRLTLLACRSGCSTLLKTIAGETHGIYIDKGSEINYQGQCWCSATDSLPTHALFAGISPKQMNNNFRGEAIYTAEQDVHFPALTVGDTLAFAAEARAVSLARPRR